MLQFLNLTKRYANGNAAVKDFSLEVKRGEFVVLIGPSGCGKSTTMRMVNRLEEPSSGTIEIDGRDYKTYHPVELRRLMGYVIQQVGLIPHLTIAENISYVLKLKGVKIKERRKRAIELLELIGMSPEIYLDRYPTELSGGQQQRIGVLRALAHDPEIILMDEPFGALDPITREQLQDELKRLHRNVHKTILFVTHDMDEAIRLADRIVIMQDGHIIQASSPEQILRSPANEFVANFIGRKRLLRQSVEIRVGEVMIQPMVTLQSSTSVAQALELMQRMQVDIGIVVNEEASYKGLVFLEELKKVFSQVGDATVNALAKQQDVCVTRDSPVLNSINLMLTHRLEAIAVTESNGNAVGLVMREDLVGLLAAATKNTSLDPIANDANDKTIVKVVG